MANVEYKEQWERKLDFVRGVQAQLGLDEQRSGDVYVGESTTPTPGEFHGIDEADPDESGDLSESFTREIMRGIQASEEEWVELMTVSNSTVEIAARDNRVRHEKSKDPKMPMAHWASSSGWKKLAKKLDAPPYY